MYVSSWVTTFLVELMDYVKSVILAILSVYMITYMLGG